MLEKILKWRALVVEAKKLKDEEAKLRRELCGEFLKTKLPPCKNKFEFEGMKIEAVNGVSYKIDPSVVDQLFNDFTDAEKNCFKFKPELKLREYKALVDRPMIDEAITEAPSMPTLKIVDI